MLTSFKSEVHFTQQLFFSQKVAMTTTTAPSRLSKKQRQDIIERWNRGETDAVRTLGYQVTQTTTGKTQVKRIFTDAEKAQRKEAREERRNHPPPPPPEPVEEDDWMEEPYDPKNYAKPSPQPKIPTKIAKPPMTKEQKMLKHRAILEMASGGTEPKPEPKPKKTKKSKPEYIIEDEMEDTYLQPDKSKKPNIL
jgi:hypothetical protein